MPAQESLTCYRASRTSLHKPSHELLALALPFISLYRLRMHPGLQSNWVPSCASCPSDPSEGERLDKHMLMAVYDSAE